MPKMVSEIAPGQSYEFSAEESGIASRQVRVFRVIKSSPSEYINVFAACGVYIGNVHPDNPELYCESVSAQYEGDSRLVLLITFNYIVSISFEQGAGGGGGGSDRLSKSPDIRPANWSVSTSLVEVPAFSWRQAEPDTGASPIGKWKTITNPVGDLYEGVSKTEGVITINVEQWEANDPTRHAKWAGYVNQNVITLGALVMERRTVMFRGVQTQPAVEQYNSRIYKGWKATYEFLFRNNTCQISDDNGDLQEVNIGWDRAQPQSGFNCKNLAPLEGESFSVEDCEEADPPMEAGAMILASAGSRIKGWPNTLELARGVNGRKARAMVLVAEYEGAGASQRPSAQPIPLNDNGTPRWAGDGENENYSPVLVYRYQVQPEIDLRTTLGLRLRS